MDDEVIKSEIKNYMHKPQNGKILIKLFLFVI